MKKLLAVVVFCLPAFGQAAYSGRGLYPGSAVYGATVSEGGPLTYAARTDNCVHGYSTNAYTVAPFYSPANETCTGAALTSISGNGSVVTVTTGTAPSGATVMIDCNSGAYTGGPFTISGDPTTFTYSSTATGSSSGCVWQAGTGEAGSALIFQEGVGDPLPFNRLDAGTSPAVANTSYTDPDFGSYAVWITDNSPQVPYGQTSNTYQTTVEGLGAGQPDGSDTLFAAQNVGSIPFFWHIIESRFLAHTCTPANPCAVQSNIYGVSGCVPSVGSVTGCTSSQMSTGNITLSRNPNDTPNTVYETYPPFIYKDTWNSSLTSGFPNGASDTVTRAFTIDFSSDGPGGAFPCSIVPTDYNSLWSGEVLVSNTGAFSISSGGGGSYQTIWEQVGGSSTPGAPQAVTSDVFIMPVNNLIGGTGGATYMFQASTGTTSGTEPLWGTNCTTLSSTCTDGGVTWTNIGKVGGQGNGFDILMFDPARGCRRVNTRLTKIYNGTNEGPNWPASGTADAAGQWITSDAVTQYRMTGSYTPGAYVNVTDAFTIHDGSQQMSTQYASVTPTGAGAVNHNYVGGSGVPLASAPNGSCTPPIAYTTFATWPNTTFGSGGNAYTHSQYVTSAINHTYYQLTGATGTYTTDPSLDSANWNLVGTYCYLYLFDKYSNHVTPILEIGPNYGGDSHQAAGYLNMFKGGPYRAHVYSQWNCNEVNNGNPPFCDHIGAPNPGTQLLATALPGDGHLVYSNDGVLDLQPIYDTTTSVPSQGGVGLPVVCGGGPGAVSGYCAAGFDEQIMIGSSGAQMMYRMAHNYNTASSPFYEVQNAFANVGENGKISVFTTDGMNTRGDTVTGSATCGGGYTVAGSKTSGTFNSPGEVVIQSGTSATANLTDRLTSSTMGIGPITGGTANNSGVWIGQTSGGHFTPTALPLAPGGPLRGSYTPAKNGCVALNDYVMPITSSNGSVYQITSLGSATHGTCGSNYQEASTALPTWSTCSSTGSTCTDSVGIVFTNEGVNSCRGDLVLLDLLSAHALP